MINVEGLTLENVKAVSEIEKECIETPWGYDELLKEISNENAFYVCISTDGETAGYGGMRICADYADITNIAVLEKYRRKGFGTLILNELIKTAKNNGVNDMTLEVNENNAPAISLYKKCGFSKAGIRKRYYNNKDNAVIMKIVL